MFYFLTAPALASSDKKWKDKTLKRLKSLLQSRHLLYQNEYKDMSYMSSVYKISEFHMPYQ